MWSLTDYSKLRFWNEVDDLRQSRIGNPCQLVGSGPFSISWFLSCVGFLGGSSGPAQALSFQQYLLQESISFSRNAILLESSLSAQVASCAHLWTSLWDQRVTWPAEPALSVASTPGIRSGGRPTCIWRTESGEEWFRRKQKSRVWLPGWRGTLA